MVESKILIISTEKRFSVNEKGQIVNEDNTRSASFWNRYLIFFDKIVIVGRVDSSNVIDKCQNYVETDFIKVFRVPNYQGLWQGLLKLRRTKLYLNKLVNTYKKSNFLLRLPGAIGNTLSTILVRSKINYSIELVGDPYEVFLTQNGFLSTFLAWKSKRSLKFAMANAHSVAYVTERYLQRKFPFNHGVSTYYSSIELNKNFLISEPKIFVNKKLSLIGIGSLEMPYKGVSILLNALIRLHKMNIDFKLIWIGTGKLLDELKSVAIKGGIEHKVDFVGTIANEDIYKIFAKNNIFILPSLTEGLPRAMIEAMASRLICLGSDVGGIPELINSQCLFSSNSSDSIVNILNDVNDRFDHYTSYANSNHEKAKEYLPEVLKERRLTFYKSILA